MTTTGEAGSIGWGSSSRPRRRSLFAGLATAIVALIAAPGAWAANVSFNSPGQVLYTADVGVEDDVTVTANPDSVTIEVVGDTISEASSECTGNATDTVTCAVGDPAELTGVKFELGDLDDTFSSSGTRRLSDQFNEAAVDAGPGDDTLTNSGPAVANLAGGLGNDRLTGGPQGDTLNGGGGDDRSSGGDGSDVIIDESGTDSLSGGGDDDVVEDSGGNGDRIEGGEGNDTLLVAIGEGHGDLRHGGPGTDTLMLAVPGFAGSSPAVTVDLSNGVETAASEANAIAGIEDVITSQGADTITGDAGPNRIASTIGATGIVGAVFPTQLPDGGDTVDPGAGSDFVATGAGEDSIHVVDGSTDHVACGPGHDSVQADQLDLLTDCEAVSRTDLSIEDSAQPAPAPAPATAADTTRPSCSLFGLPRKRSRRAFLRGARARVRCNEAVSVEATLSVRTRPRRGRAVVAAAGDLILAERLKASRSARHTVRLRPPRRLRRLLPGRFRAKLRIVARDAAGNGTSLVRAVRVIPDRSKRKRKRPHRRASG